ncbi:MAG: dual specificity protein phosphatase family protein [Desulfuromonadaceae bacterium]
MDCPNPLRRSVTLRCFLALLLLVFLLPAALAFSAAAISPFSSDGCSLFPDGTTEDRNRWCDCCFAHDQAYWQGGTKEQRLLADQTLRDCVLQRTGNRALAEAMYLGVRGGGQPIFPSWYRWGYGWPYGRGYQALDEEEQQQVALELERYARVHPQGYCVAEGESSRPASWAVAQPAAELKNFYRLDAKVYRSAQPDEAGFAALEALGIRNILSLRQYHSDEELAPADFQLYRVKMYTRDIPSEQVIAALRIIRASEGPILIHCWHGADRTGLVSALYRMVFQGWSKADAIDELTNGGYGYHALFFSNITDFIKNADMKAIRAAVFAEP